MPKRIVEAALFMSPKPVTTKELSKITGFPEGQVEERLEELQKDYDSENKGVEITRDPEGWGMRVKPGILPQVAHLTPYSDLKDGHKRTLALVAYKEPIKQSDIIRIQGNKAYSYIKRLEKKGLIKSHKEGRTKILSLTQGFERYFGEEKSRIKEMLSQGVVEMDEEERQRREKKQKEAEEKEARQEQETLETEMKKEPEEVEERKEENKEEEKEDIKDRIKRMEKKLKDEEDEEVLEEDEEKAEDEEKTYSDVDKVIPFSKD
jgi:segregation and condensation protein B